MRARAAILSRLADGRFHSGEDLASELGLTRAAVWKQIRVLESRGLEIYSVRGKGHRLAVPLELLDPESIIAAAGPSWAAAGGCLQILFETGSTNRQLLAMLASGSFHARVVMAEFQTAGRGRRGSSWISPPAAGISLSLGWYFESPPTSLPALSLAVGVAVARALIDAGVAGIHLKWPNDIICNGRKLGGILIESRGESTGPFDVVIGVGINVRLPDPVLAAIDQPVTDVSRNFSGRISRNALAGGIIAELTSMLGRFSDRGFAPFLEQWRQLDYFQGRDASLVCPDKTVRGRVLGIDGNGMLVMSVDGEQMRFSNGELSLRMIE